MRATCHNDQVRSKLAESTNYLRQKWIKYCNDRKSYNMRSAFKDTSRNLIWI